MSSFVIPTSKDIYIEVDGMRLGVVESYKSVASRKSRTIEAFGEDEPVATIAGKVTYTLELSRVDTSPAYSDGVDFFALSNFNLVVVKADRRIVYSGCEWYEAGESLELGGPVIEKVKITAARRRVI